MSCMTKVGGEERKAGRQGGGGGGGEEVPSRAELAQYQRRFIELYDQGRGRGEEGRWGGMRCHLEQSWPSTRGGSLSCMTKVGGGREVGGGGGTI